VIQRTPTGIFIYGEPTDLNQLEQVLGDLSAMQGAGGLLSQDVGTFYLKHTTAEVASQLLGDLVGATSDSSSLVSDMATNLIGGGGILSALMGGGGGADGGATLSTGTMTIVPDPRLNRLIIIGSSQELDEAEMLLRVIDKDRSITEIETAGRPWVIPIINTSAENVAEVVKETFASRMGGQTGGQTGGRGGQQRGPSPQDLAQLFGGRGGRGGAASQPNRGALPQMTVAVHSDSNSLIVMAPEPLYQQVLLLVEEIDRLDEDYSERIVVMGIKDVNSDVMKEALGNIFGNVGSTSGQSQNNNSSNNGSASTPTDAAAAQRRADFFRAISNARGGAGGAPTGRGGGAPTGRGGGAPSGRGGGAPTGRGGGGRGGR
jgi:type II secretory pathway component GspD/PulD (secretin)